MKCLDTCCRPERDDPPMVDISCRAHTARREHLCTICRYPIEISERYIRRVMIIDGDFTSFAHHMECDYA